VTAGTSGKIKADTAGVAGDSTGTITVGSIAKVLIRDAAGGAGNEVGNLTITADDSLTLFAAGYDAGNNFIGDVVVDWTSSGVLEPAVNALGVSSITFLPRTAPASGKIFASHATAADDSTGTITVSPGAPFGTVVLTPTPPALLADDTSKSQITSSAILDQDGNLVRANQLFTVNMSPSNLGTIITPDVSGLPGHQIATDLNSQLDFIFQAGNTGGTVFISVSSVTGSAAGNTSIAMGSMSIISVVTDPEFVSQGQTGIEVRMVVDNRSSSPVANVSAGLTFMGSVDRTGQYTQQRTDGITSIPAQSQRTLTFNVSVDQSAALEVITMDGNVNGDISGTPVSAEGAGTTDSWTVQIPAALNAKILSSAGGQQDTVTVGQQGIVVTARVENPAGLGAATAVIDSIKLRFLKDGIEDRTVDFPFVTESGNPTSIAGGQELDFNFTVGVGATADTGNYVVDVRVFGRDANSNSLIQDFGADTKLNWYVKGATTLQIVSLTPKPNNTVFAGQTEDWTVTMVVQNNGPDAIDLDLSPDKTFIQFRIGINDVTSEYIIIYPTDLASGGTILSANSTDSLDFIINMTGSTTGTITIFGRVKGTDLVTGKKISDNTDDFGAGQINVIPKASIRITDTKPVTTNFEPIAEKGFVNTNQPFQIRVEVENRLDEPVVDVVVKLTSNGSSNIAANQDTIAIIAASSSQSMNFNVSAAPTQNLETFKSQILEGTVLGTQTPAQIATPTDSIALVEIQIPALLDVKFTKIDPFQTARDTFQVRAKVTNSGQADVDNSGKLRLITPSNGNYTLFPATDSVQSFTPGQAVEWQVIAPQASTVSDTFIVQIFQIPKELNTDALAATQAATDTAVIRTLDVDLIIQDFSIISPDGAKDDTVSTKQTFDIKMSFSASQNLDSIRAKITLPNNYRLEGGFQEDVEVPQGQEFHIWRVVSPEDAIPDPRTFSVDVRGWDNGILRAEETDSLDVVTIPEANLSLTQFFISDPSGQTQVSTNQTFQLQAVVENNGQAGIIEVGELRLNLQNSGIQIAPGDTLIKPFTPFNNASAVSWTVIAPSFPTPPEPIKVEISTIPQDENKNRPAKIGVAFKILNVETIESGNIVIDSVRVKAPEGAKDGTLSTDQELRVEAFLTMNNTINVQAQIALPGEYGFIGSDQAFKSIPDTVRPRSSVIWNLKAPNQPLSDHFIIVKAFGNDVGSGQLINARDDTIRTMQDAEPLVFKVKSKANLSLTAAITAPPSATDQILTVGQNFTVTTALINNGEAGLSRPDSLQLQLPSGYKTNEPLVKSSAPMGLATWQIQAPNSPTGILNIVVRVKQVPLDENSNQEAFISPSVVSIAVSTEPISLTTSVLTEKKPTTVTRGGKNISIFGLRFRNEGDTRILIESIKFSVKDKDGKELAPNSVFKGLKVVDYENSAIVHKNLAQLSADNPVLLDNFSPAISVDSLSTKSIDIQVDINTSTQATSFQLVIESPQDDILAIDESSGRVVAIKDTVGSEINDPLTSDFSVLIGTDIQSSFFNFPNPFGHAARPTTRFNYYLKQDSDLTIRIYTLLGELVWSRVFKTTDPEGKAGNHDGDVTWDGTNDKGQRVLNGVYIAVIITNSGKATTKIAITR
jgi:hypothetical protein